NADQLHELLRTSTGLAEELAQLFEQAGTLGASLDGESGGKQELARALQHQIALEHDIRQEDAVIQTLQLLDKNHVQQLRASLADEAGETFGRLVQVRGEADLSELCVDIRVPANEDTCAPALADQLGDTLHALHRMGALPARMATLVHALLKHLVTPLLRYHTCTLNERSSEGKQALLLALDGKSPITSLATDALVDGTDAMYASIERVVKFLLDLLSLPHDEAATADIRLLLSDTMVPPMYEAIVSNYLQQAMPVEYAHLDLFDTVNKRTRQFHDNMKQLGLTIQDDNRMMQFTRETEQHYAHKKHRHTLEHARKLLAGYDFTSVQLRHPSWQSLAVTATVHYTDNHTVDATVPSPTRSNGNGNGNGSASGGSALPHDPFAMPVCLVSTTALQLKQAIEDIAAEACQLTSDHCIELLQSIREMAQLFQILVPQQQARILDSVPAMAMQFHNDCMLLAHCLLVLDITYGAQWPEHTRRLATHTTDLVPIVRHLGQVHFSRIVIHQQDALLEAYNELDGLHDAGESERYERIQQTILQTVYQLRKLSDVWRATLPLPLHDRAMGRIVDHLLVRLTKDIIALADISEAESYQLHKACQMLFELANLFRVKDQQPPPPHYVPSWTRFRQLVELLELNFADIMERFRAHALDVFTADELTSIVCALFSDTPLRKKNLEEIRGTPRDD
ncbi:Centromere/kinetochore Zw10-domain-containing protein, partial [Syncephalis pseudoplumigaleata]